QPERAENRAAVGNQQANLRRVGAVERMAPKIDPQLLAPAVETPAPLPVARLERPHGARGNTAQPPRRLCHEHRPVRCKTPPVAGRLKVEESRHNRLLLVRGWDLAGASSPGPHYTGRSCGRPLCTT